MERKPRAGLTTRAPCGRAAEATHTFTASDSDWGFSQMAPYQEIEDPASGFLADGALTARSPRPAPSPLHYRPPPAPPTRPCAHASPHAGLARRRRAPASPLHHPGSLAPSTRPCAHAGHKAGLRSVRGGGPARGLACRMQAQRGQRGLHGPLCARGARPRSRHVGGDGLTLPHPTLFRPALPSPQSVKHCSSKPCSSKPCSSGRC